MEEDVKGSVNPSFMICILLPSGQRGNSRIFIEVTCDWVKDKYARRLSAATSSNVAG